MKKITDKERLDWLLRDDNEVTQYKEETGIFEGGWRFYSFDSNEGWSNKTYRSKRSSIDAAIRASRRGK